MRFSDQTSRFVGIERNPPLRNQNRNWMDPTTEHHRFSYRAIPPRNVAPFLRGVGLAHEAGDVEDIHIDAVRFDRFFIANVRVTDLAVTWSRLTERARSRCMFIFASSGSIEIEGKSPHWSSTTGGLCIVFPGDSPVSIKTLKPSQLLFFTFDESEISPMVLSPETIADDPSDSAVLRASYYCLAALTAQPRSDHENLRQSSIMRSLTRDVARAITAATTVEPNSQTGLLTAALRLIALESSNPDLSVEEIARRCGVSRRTLARSFAQRELQVSQELRRERARRAMEFINQGRYENLTAIALASGFPSLSSLERALLTVYQISPKRAEMMHRAAAADDRTDRIIPAS